jgi:hypothetical protein
MTNKETTEGYVPLAPWQRKQLWWRHQQQGAYCFKIEFSKKDIFSWLLTKHS